MRDVRRLSSFRYVDLAAMLRAQILAGHIRPGELLLSENELCRKFAMSRNSVRQALAVLVDEGLVERKAGKGTIVSERPDAGKDEHTLVIAHPYPSTYVEHAMPVLLRHFRDKYPHVRVKLFAVPPQGHHDLGGRGKEGGWPFEPDLVLIGDDYLPLITPDDYHPLPERLHRESGIAGKLFGPALRGGIPYALPVTFSPIYLICNRDVFEKSRMTPAVSGWTIEQFVETAARLTSDTNGDGIDDRFGFGITSDISRLLAVALKCGATFRGRKGKRGEEREALVRALKLLQDLIYRHRVCLGTAVRDPGLMHRLFYEGRIAMLFSSTYLGVAKASFAVNVLPFPGAAADSGNVLLALALVMPRSGNRPDLAGLFCEVAHDPDVQREIAANAGLLSVHDKVNRDIIAGSNYDSMYIDPQSLGNSYYVHELFPSPELVEKVRKQLDGFWAGIVTPEQAAETLLKAIRR